MMNRKQEIGAKLAIAIAENMVAEIVKSPTPDAEVEARTLDNLIGRVIAEMNSDGKNRSKLEKVYKLKSEFSMKSINFNAEKDLMRYDFSFILEWIQEHPMAVWLHKYLFAKFFGIQKFKLSITDIQKEIDKAKSKEEDRLKRLESSERMKIVKEMSYEEFEKEHPPLEK